MNRSVYAELSFTEEGIDMFDDGYTYLPGMAKHTGSVIVVNEGSVTYHRFKYVPPVFTSPAQNKLVKGPAMVVASTVGSSCVCGKVMKHFQFETPYNYAISGTELKCLVCGRSIVTRRLTPTAMGTGAEDEDVLCSGRYAEEEYAGIIYRARGCYDVLELPEVVVVLEGQDTPIPYSSFRKSRSAARNVLIRHKDPMVGLTTVGDLMGRRTPFTFKVVRTRVIIPKESSNGNR